jgi:hypothetical protein
MRRLMAVLAVAASVPACADERSPPPTTPTAEPTVQLVEIEGAYQLASPGLTTQLRAFATYSDGIQYDVTRDAAWIVLDEGVVRVAPGGVATATGYGNTAVHASYRDVRSRFGFGFWVTALAGQQYSLVGVARDASTGAPLGGAHVAALFSGVTRFATSDGNGFFDLGTAAGPTTISVGRIGYDDTAMSANVAAVTRVAVSLVPIPGAFIERTIEDRFTEIEGPYGVWTYGISTRPAGRFDAEVQGLDCADSPVLQLQAFSDDAPSDIVRNDFSCYARVRFPVTDGDIRIVVHGRHVSRFRFTYREPR